VAGPCEGGVLTGPDEGRLIQTRVVWVPETLHRSRDLLILVEQSTEPVAPLDGVRIVRRRLGEWS
jgi:hypothetical protein